MSGHRRAPFMPLGPSSNADVPRYLRDMERWRAECADVAVFNRRVDMWSFVIHCVGFIGMVAALLWAMS